MIRHKSLWWTFPWRRRILLHFWRFKGRAVANLLEQYDIGTFATDETSDGARAFRFALCIGFFARLRQAPGREPLEIPGCNTDIAVFMRQGLRLFVLGANEAAEGHGD